MLLFGFVTISWSWAAPVYGCACLRLWLFTAAPVELKAFGITSLIQMGFRRASARLMFRCIAMGLVFGTSPN